MITTKNLMDLGFKETSGVFYGKKVWVLGEEDTEICGNPCRLPIVYYNIETQTCQVVMGAFCVVKRECKSEEEIRKFVESINFLFRITVVVKNSEKKQSIILLVMQRTLAFPFFLGIAFVGASIMFAKWVINFIRFGGESIAYTDKMNRKTIQDVFVKLNEMQQREKS